LPLPVGHTPIACSVIYTPDGSDVRVVAVAHQHHSAGSWREKLGGLTKK
jgi:hypothetical protein